MLDTPFRAGLVKTVLTGGLFIFTGEATFGLRAVVGQQLDDLHGGGGVYATSEVDTAVQGGIRVDRQEYPAGSAFVEPFVEPASSRLEASSTSAGILGRYLIVDARKAGLIILDSLGRRRRRAFDPR